MDTLRTSIEPALTATGTGAATAAAAGDYLQVEGDGTAVLKGGATSKYFVTAGFPNAFIVPAGCVINIVHAAAMTGTLQWHLWWEPLGESATVTAA